MKKHLKVSAIVILIISLIIPSVTYADINETTPSGDNKQETNNDNEGNDSDNIQKDGQQELTQGESANPPAGNTTSTNETANTNNSGSASESGSPETSHQHDYIYTYVTGDQHSVLCTNCNLEMVLEDCAYTSDSVCVRCGHKRDEENFNTDAEVELAEKTLTYEGSYTVTVTGMMPEDASLNVSENDSNDFEIEHDENMNLIPLVNFDANIDSDKDFKAANVTITVSGLEKADKHFSYVVTRDGNIIGNFMDSIKFEDDDLGSYIIFELVEKDSDSANNENEDKDDDDGEIKPSYSESEISSDVKKEAENILKEKIESDNKYNHVIVDSFDLSVPDETEFPIQLKFNANVSSDMNVTILHKANSEWEEITPDEVGNGYLVATFDSLSPIVIVNQTTTEASGYTVRFFNGEEKLSEKVYQKGTAVEVPTVEDKEVDNKLYEFDGWTVNDNTDDVITSEQLPAVTEAVDYHAHFTVTDSVHVKWLNKDQSIISETTVKKGSIPLAPANPSYTDKIGVYTFKNWTPALPDTLEDNSEFTAEYELKDENKLSYRYIWKDYDGTELKNVVGHIDTVDTTAPADPEREKDDTFYYRFKGWDADKTVDEAYNEWKDANKGVNDEIVITNTANYVAYESSSVKYAVTFKNWDNSIISKNAYKIGESIMIPTYPEREADASYEYEFKGWNPEIQETCNGAITYVAQYTKKAITKDVKIIFKNYDGEVISEKIYETGDNVEKPSDPTRDSDDNYDYTFEGWSPSFVETAQKDMTYVAQYTKTAKTSEKSYTIVFKNYDGSTISNKTYKNGEIIEVPANPTRRSDSKYVYEFKGWSPTVSEKATADRTYTAQYTKKMISAQGNNNTNMTMFGNNSITPKTNTNTVNKTASTTSSTGVKTDSATGKVSTKTSSSTTKNSVTGTCKITFINWDDSVISEKAYKKGDKIEIPADPVRGPDEEYTYEFRNWSPVVSETAEKAVTYKAQFIKIQKKLDTATESTASVESDVNKQAEEAKKAEQLIDKATTEDPKKENTVIARPHDKNEDTEVVTEGRQQSGIPGFVWYIVLAMILISGIAAGVYFKLWFALWNKLNAGRRSSFHGLLVDEDDKFIDVVLPDDADDDVRMIQDEIEESQAEGESYEQLKDRLLSSEVETILPVDAKMQFTTEIDGETDYSDVMPADEATLYEILDELKGNGFNVIANIFSKSTGMNVELAFNNL